MSMLKDKPTPLICSN